MSFYNERKSISEAYHKVCESSLEKEFIAKMLEEAKRKGIKITGYYVDVDGTPVISYVNRLGRQVTTKIRPKDIKKDEWERRHFGTYRPWMTPTGIRDGDKFQDKDFPDYLMRESAEIGSEDDGGIMFKGGTSETMKKLLDDYSARDILQSIYRGGRDITSVSGDDELSERVLSILIPFLSVEDMDAIRKECEAYSAS